MSHVPFSELRTVVYCPRKLYYERCSDDRSPPAIVDRIRGLATRYEKLLEMSDAALSSEPIALDPTTYRARLTTASDRLERDGRWSALRDPDETDALVTGRRCRGIVHKVLSDPLEPALVSPGRPPETGVWAPHSVHAVAAAKALAWEHQQPIDRAWLEYPAYGVIRRVELTTRRKAQYRRALRTVRTLDGPPPRLANRSKCSACEYADECGVRTRTLRSLLGFG